MKQSDLLDSESIITYFKKKNLENRDFGILIPSIILDRFAYYGFRSIIILYAIENLHLSDISALTKYGYFTMLMYLTSLLGGVIGDFILKGRKVLVTGAVTMAIGSAACAISTELSLYIGCTLVILGSALYRPNLSAEIAKITGKNIQQLDRRYLTMYLMINIGAFFGAFLVGLLSESFGYSVGFISISLGCVVNALLLQFIRKTRVKSTRTPTKPTKIISFPSNWNFFLIALPIIGVLLFWVNTELDYSRFILPLFEMRTLFDSKSLMAGLLSSINIAVLLFAGSILLIGFQKFWFHPLQKIGIGLMMTVAVGVAIILIPDSLSSSEALTFYIVYSVILGIAELFISPVVLTVIAQYTPKKIIGTIFGLYFLLSGVSMSFLPNLLLRMDPSDNYHIIVWGVGVIGIALLFLPIIIGKESFPQYETENSNY